MIKKSKKPKAKNNKDKNIKKSKKPLVPIVRNSSKVKKHQTKQPVAIPIVEDVVNGEKILLNESNYICVMDYRCSMSAYQDPDDMAWRFALEIFTDDEMLIDIHSQQQYQTYQDSLFDCYGIIEYLGFGVIDKENCAQVVVNFWNEAEEQFDEQIIYFDGHDFFKSKKSKV